MAGAIATIPSKSSLRLHQAVSRALKGSPLPGISLVLVDRRQPTPTYENYGIAQLNLSRLEESKPVTQSTLFPIGASLAKNFTAVCVTQLHAEGKLKLDDPITKYLPDLRIVQASDPKVQASAITARHLLSHTSGIREYRNKGDVVDLAGEMLPKSIKGRLRSNKSSKGAQSLEEYYCNPKDSPIVAVGTPGGQHIKSHHNYGILALAAEKVTGQDIRSLIQMRVFKPLGMGHSDLIPIKELDDRLTASFIWSGKEGFKPIAKGGRFDASSGRPRAVGGTAYSTAEDMGRYLQALIDPQRSSNGVFSDAILDEMLKPVYRKNSFLPGQALNFSIEESMTEADPEVAYVTCGEGMSFAGYQCALVFSRYRGIGVGLLCNAGSNSYEISQVAAEALQECFLRSQQQEAVVISPSELTKASKDSSTIGQDRASGADVSQMEQQQQQQQQQVQPRHVMKSLEEARKLKHAFGMRAEGFEAAVLWPHIVGVYQLPLSQLSARVLWMLGGEVQIYVDDSRLRMRALWGPLRTKLFYTKEKGQILQPARDLHPLHYSVSAVARQVLATPVNGYTDISFDIHTNEMTIGLVTLKKSPWYMSIRLWAMGFLAYQAATLIGKGKAIEILSALFVIG